MTIPENTGRPPALPTPGKPSLMATPREAPTEGEATQPLRMLDALGDAEHGHREVAPSRIRLWLLALSLTMLAVATVSWWQQRDEATATATATRASDLVARATPASPPEPAAASAPAATPQAPPVPAVASASATGPASIERSAELDPLRVLSRPESPAAVLPASPSKAAAAPVPRVKTASASTPRAKVATANEPRRKAGAATAHGTKVVSARSPPRTASARRPEAPPPARDPDVTLLSAMLARLSSDNPGDAAAQRATIAQLAGRCDARSGKESSEAAECRRQICAGHWGKAEACPMSLAPKRN